MSRSIVELARPRSQLSIAPDPDITGLRLDEAAFGALSIVERRRIHALVLKRGLEVWREGGEIVFHRPQFPPTRAGRAAYERRHQWLVA